MLNQTKTNAEKKADVIKEMALLHPGVAEELETRLTVVTRRNLTKYVIRRKIGKHAQG